MINKKLVGDKNFKILNLQSNEVLIKKPVLAQPHLKLMHYLTIALVCLCNVSKI